MTRTERRTRHPLSELRNPNRPISLARSIVVVRGNRDTSRRKRTCGKPGIWGFCDRKQIATRAILISEGETEVREGRGRAGETTEGR